MALKMLIMEVFKFHNDFSHNVYVNICDMLTLPGISTVDHRAKRILVFAKARVYGTFLDKDNGGLMVDFRRMYYGLSDWIYL